MRLRSVAAVVAGYVLMAVLVMATSAALMAALPGAFVAPDGTHKIPEPVAAWFAFALLYSFTFACAGGYLAARIAGSGELRHAAALAGLMAVMSLLILADPGGRIPKWWTAGEMIVGIAGVLLGARWREARARRARRASA
jgi:hypothetical protein